MIRSIEKDHVCVRRTGQKIPVRLSAYKKKGAYKVSKGPNLVSEEVSCDTLEDVLRTARGMLEAAE
jgi:hypothetical protein